MEGESPYPEIINITQRKLIKKKMIKLVKLCLISCRTMHIIMGNNRNKSMRSEASGIIKQMIGDMLKTSLTQDELDELLG